METLKFRKLVRGLGSASFAVSAEDDEGGRIGCPNLWPEGLFRSRWKFHAGPVATGIACDCFSFLESSLSQLFAHGLHSVVGRISVAPAGSTDARIFRSYLAL